MPRISYPFAAVPNQIARGGHGAINIAVFVALLSHGRSTASLSTLASEAGCSRKKVQDAIKYWKAEGPKHGVRLIEEIHEKGGVPNVYEIHVDHMTQVGNDLGTESTQVGNDLPPRSETTYLPRSETTYKEEQEKKNPKEEGSELSLTTPKPKDIAVMFFQETQVQQDTAAYFVSKGMPEELVKREITKFVNYWTELNKMGTKQKWQMQETFEVKRRLVTWMQNAAKYSHTNSFNLEPKGITI